MGGRIGLGHRLAVTGILGALGKAGPAGNLIVNGGFEQPAVQQGRYLNVPVGQAFDGWEVVGTGIVSPPSAVTMPRTASASLPTAASSGST
ncbi:MAG: hypothetical protein DYH19_02355 [Gammaproteobacteria bacterium PRO8]|nr:hypothetical protein [Gammaproteobacteria bacterium PRO8]